VTFTPDGGEAARVTGDAAIATYVDLLHRYHGTLDLMSDRGLAGIDRLLADAEAYAAAVAELAPPGLVLDVGTGAGLPAVVIAARSPSRPMAWVERRRRRATFLRTVVAHCGLPGVEVYAEDVRAVAAEALATPLVAITAQAVAGWSALYGWTRHLHGATVTLIARRGEAWEDERAAFEQQVQAEVELRSAEPLEGGGTLVALLVRGGLPCP
jgi:16S rRNA G527 N7-methylase RsmG